MYVRFILLYSMYISKNLGIDILVNDEKIYILRFVYKIMIIADNIFQNNIFIWECY